MQLTVREAAALLNLPEEKIYAWIDENEIPAHRVNDQVRLNRAELLEWATAKGMRVSLDIVREPRGSSWTLGLVDALIVGGVHTIDADDRPTALRMATQSLPISDSAEREVIASILLARDGMRANVGEGIAIPHVNHPIVLHGSRPAIALCALKKPLGDGVSTIFLVVTPTPKVHLQLLSRLSQALLDPAFKRAVIERRPSEEILREAARVEEAFAR